MRLFESNTSAIYELRFSSFHFQQLINLPSFRFPTTKYHGCLKIYSCKWIHVNQVSCIDTNLALETQWQLNDHMSFYPLSLQNSLKSSEITYRNSSFLDLKSHSSFLSWKSSLANHKWTTTLKPSKIYKPRVLDPLAMINSWWKVFSTPCLNLAQ